MDFKTIPFEIKSTSETGSEFDGYANAFHNIDSAQEIVGNGSFVETIPQFLEFGFIGNVNHGWDTPLGRPTAASEQPKGLFVGGKISPTSYGKDCMILLKDKVIKKLSIGYRVLGDTMLEDSDACAEYWKSVGYTPSAQDIARSQYGARLLTKLHLYEFSPVTVAANDMADITRVKHYSAAELPNKRAFEAFLRDSGLSRKEAVEMIAVLFKGLQREADEAANPEADMPPAEPEPPTAETAPEETPIEAKTEAEPITEVRPSVVVVDVSQGAHQQQVQALYANFLDIKARSGLGAP